MIVFAVATATVTNGAAVQSLAHKCACLMQTAQRMGHREIDVWLCQIFARIRRSAARATCHDRAKLPITAQVDIPVTPMPSVLMTGSRAAIAAVLALSVRMESAVMMIINYAPLVER